MAIGNGFWYRRRDSNPHCLVSKTSASFQLGYAGMVNPAGLEPATCRLGNDSSYPSELRVREFGYGGRIRTYVNEFQRLAPFQLGHSVRFVDWWTWHDLNVRPRPSQSRALIPLSYRSVKLAEGTGLEPASASAVVFKTTALPVRLPFRRIVGACGRTRTHEGRLRPPDLQSGAFAARPHMRVNFKFQISTARDFKSKIHYAKK